MRARTLNANGTLRCTGCDTDKYPARFPIARAKKTGRASWCKACQANYHRANKERAHVNMKRNHLRRNYGMTLDEVIELGNSQSDQCPICKQPLVYERYGYAIDHDHGTGEVRGILCFSCNRSLGGFKDDPMLLRSAADYLEKNK